MTGDLVRFRSNGDMEYLGRTDNQVKIRGFRIELGEIETALSQYPAVSQAVAVVREDQPGDKRLVAYVAANRMELKSSELRHFLQGKLPEYMVPSAFVMLNSIPLTANGKVDRRALPVPDRSRLDDEKSYVPPSTPVEEALSEIWSSILGIERVGIHNNFFELGGDSILSIQIIARANKLGLRLTPKQLFQHQTVAELAAVAGTANFIRAEQGVVTGPVTVTPIQHWFFEQNLPDEHHFNQGTMLELRGSLKLPLLKRAIQLLLLHHDALRLRFVREASGWKQFNAGPESSVPLAILDLATVGEAQQDAAMRAGIAELHESLNLSEGPLVRIAFFDLGSERSGRLLIVIHHLVIDGVSWRILIEDLRTAYDQLVRGETVKLPPKTTSFQQWAERLEAHARSGVLAKEQSFWLVDERQQTPPLPVDYSGCQNTEHSADRVKVVLSSDETRALLQKVPVAYGTQINEVLLAALVQAFENWTGEPTVLIDLEGHGREEIVEGVDLSRTVGWFTTIFPVLLKLEGAMDTGNALKTIKEQLRRIPNRGIGYGLLRYMSADAKLAEQLRLLPLAQVSFNYKGQFGQDRSPGSLFSSVLQDCGPNHSPKQTRNHLVDIDGAVIDGQLKLEWIYSRNIHRRETIETLAGSFVSALQQFIIQCQSPASREYRPSDFPLAGLDQTTLDKLSAQIEQFDAIEGQSN